MFCPSHVIHYRVPLSLSPSLPPSGHGLLSRSQVTLPTRWQFSPCSFRVAGFYPTRPRSSFRALLLSTSLFHPFPRPWGRLERDTTPSVTYLPAAAESGPGFPFILCLDRVWTVTGPKQIKAVNNVHPSPTSGVYSRISTYSLLVAYYCALRITLGNDLTTRSPCMAI